MIRILVISTFILGLPLFLMAQNTPGFGAENKCKGMMDSSMSCNMMKMHMMSPKAAFATSDGGVVIIMGNKMIKYDKDLNLKKEVELKIDSTAMNSMMQMMPQCPGMKSEHKGADSSGMNKR